MLVEMREIIDDGSWDADAERAYGELFGNSSRYRELIAEMREIAAKWKEPAHLRRDVVVFATMIDPPGTRARDYPLSDIGKMPLEAVDEIPAYLKSHPYADEASQIDEESLSDPLLLTTSEDLLACWAYTMDSQGEQEIYMPALLAAAMYEMSLLEGTIEGSDTKKEELAERSRERLGCGPEQAFRKAKPEPEPVSADLDVLRLARYNARLEMYERLHFDVLLERARKEEVQ